MTEFTPGAELYIDGAWVDITDDIYQRDDIVITRGKPNEANITDPSSMTMTLDNRSGDYSIRNPLGPYYGKFNRNTPIRVGARRGFGLGMDASGGYASTPDTAGNSVTGDLDLRCEITSLSGAWAGVAPTIAIIASKYGAAGQKSWAWILNTVGTMQFIWSADGTAELTASTGANGVPESDDQTRYFRVTMDIDNGASGRTVTFYEGDSISGPWTQLVAPVTTAGVTSIFNSTAALACGASAGALVGSANRSLVRKFEMYNGISGTLVANPDFSAQAAGTTSFADSFSTWTTVGAGRIGYFLGDFRFYGEVSSWPAKWDKSGEDATMEIEAAGILRRLAQGEALARTPIDTWVTGDSGDLGTNCSFVAYWPFDELPGASGSATNKVDGSSSFALMYTKEALAAVRVPTASELSSRYGQASLLDWLPASPKMVVGDSIAASIAIPTAITGTRGWELDFIFTGDENSVIQVTMFTGATGDYRLLIDGAANTVQVVTPAGSSSAVAWDFVLCDGIGKTVNYTIYQSGADVVINLAISSNFYGEGFFGTTDIVDDGFSYTAVGDTLENLTFLSFDHISSTDPKSIMSIGHILVLSVEDDNNIYNVQRPAAGYPGDIIWERAQLIAEELGATVNIGSPILVGTAMGVQRQRTPLELLAECAETGAGLLSEDRTAMSLTFRTWASFKNRTPVATITYSDHEISPTFAPVDDDQLTRNYVTRKSIDSGVEVTHEQTSGSLNDGDPSTTDGVGKYPSSKSVSVFTDTQAGYLASWALALGTYDSPRFPLVVVDRQNPDVIANATLYSAMTTIDVGSIIELDGLSDVGLYDSYRLVVNGYQETLNRYVRRLELNCVPAEPYDTLTLNSSTLGFIDSSSSTLTSDVNSSTTSISVTSTAELWTTGAVTFDIVVGGERMTVSNISGASSPQTFTVTRAINGVAKSHTAGDKISLQKPFRLGL